MAEPKYYFPVCENQKPIRLALSTNGQSYDVHWGVSNHQVESLLGQPGIRVKTAKTEDQVVTHFQRHDYPHTDIVVYNALFGTFNILQAQKEPALVPIKPATTAMKVCRASEAMRTNPFKTSFKPSLVWSTESTADLIKAYGLFSEKTSDEKLSQNTLNHHCHENSLRHKKT